MRAKVKKSEENLGISPKSEPKETILAEIFPVVINTFSHAELEKVEMLTTDAFTAVKQTKTQSWKNGKEIQGCVRLPCMKEDFSVRRCLTAKKATCEEKET